MCCRAQWPRAVLAAALFAALAAPAFAQQSEMAALATRVAEKLAKSGKNRVFVADFIDDQRRVTQLGRDAADDFSRLLSTANKGLLLIPRLGQIGICRLTHADVERDLSKCLAISFGMTTKVEIVILGRITTSTDLLHLELEAWKFPNLQKQDFQMRDTSLAFREESRLPLDDKSIAKLTQVLMLPDSDEYKVSAGPVKPAAEDLPPQKPQPLPPGAAQAGKDGVSYPQCAYCPPPGRAPDDRTASYSVTVLLRITITAKGDAENVRIEKTPNEELGKRAIEVVKKWKFQPARNKAGKAVPVEIMIEVAFT